MRHFVTAVAAACAAAGMAGPAAAQIGVPTGSQPPAAMPGQVVGSSYTLNPVATPIPRATTPAGSPIGSPFAKPELGATINPFKNTNVDPKLLAAPAMGYPGSPYQEPDLIDKVYDKLKSVTAFFKPSPAQTTTYTPGISRRNKERAMERTWRRD
jgi:hypothetical protein